MKRFLFWMLCKELVGIDHSRSSKASQKATEVSQA